MLKLSIFVSEVIIMKKVALITGGSRGIGAEIVNVLANNFDVAFTYNNSYDNALIIKKENDALFKTVEMYKCDVSNRTEVNALINSVISEFGKIDVLVNNAGIAHEGLFTDITEEEWDNIFNVNVKGVFNCTQAVLPYMIKRHEGCIINISSMWGEVGASCEVAYSASKAAVIGLTKALAKEVGPSNINVNCICPGVINTDMMAGYSDSDIEELKEQTPLRTIGMPIDIANMTAFLASDNAKFITGQTFGVNGGIII
jgi:3-oxoacyl-[acyl-carrier protein] reductase